MREMRRPDRRAYDAQRPASHGFYSCAAWRKLRARILGQHPLCVECLRLGRVTPGLVVDHIIPYRTRPDLGLIASNLRALCAACHNRIGATYEQPGNG